MCTRRLLNTDYSRNMIKSTVWFLAGGLFTLAVFGVSIQLRTYFAKKNLTIVAFGDSTTAQRNYPGEIPVKIYTTIMQDELNLSLPGMGVTVVNAGFGGDDTDRAMLRFNRDVIAYKPDIVIVQFGINDAAIDVRAKPARSDARVAQAKFIKNITFFITELEKIGSKVILMTPNPNCWNKQTIEWFGVTPYRIYEPDGINFNLINYANSIREIAKQYSRLYFIDIYQAFKKRMESHPSENLIPDCVHPYNEGHRLIANLLIQKIRDIYK